MTTRHTLTIALLFFLTAGCADTIGAPGQWTFGEEAATPDVARPDVTQPDVGISATADTDPEPADCDLSTCGEVPSCFEATCTAAGTCEIVPAPAGTPCDDGDFCSVLSTCDGAGACVDGSPAGMYATTDDALKLVEVLPDGAMFLVGSRYSDERWRPIAALLESDGALRWSRLLQSSDHSVLTGGIPVEDGWLVVGRDDGDVMLHTLDRGGETRWSRRIDGAATGGSPGIIRLDDDSALLFGRTADSSEGRHGADAWLRAVRLDGTELWSRRIDTPTVDNIGSVSVRGDGEVTVVTQRWSYDIDGAASTERPRVTELLELSADGTKRSQRELFSTPYGVVVWTGWRHGALELVMREPTPGERTRRTVLYRIPPAEPIEEVAILEEGADSVSVTLDTEDRLIVLRGSREWTGYTIAERWDHAGHVIDTGIVVSPTGDRVGLGPGTFVDRDTLVASGNIHAAQSGYAWSRAGTVILRARPFHHTDCSDEDNYGEVCLLASIGESCVDDNPCTADLCDIETGCEYREFYDGMPCGGGRVCHAGQCVEECVTTCEPGTGWCSGTGVTICEADSDGCTDLKHRPCEGDTRCVVQDQTPRCAPAN